MKETNEQLQFPDFSGPPKIVDTMKDDPRANELEGRIPADEDYDPSIQPFMKYRPERKPWIYNDQDHTVYMGAQGAYHSDTAKFYQIPYRNTGGITNDVNSKYEDRVPDSVVDAISDHYGISNMRGLKNPGEEFKFANILDPIHDTLAPEVWDNPGDPEPIFKPQHAKWLKHECIKILNEGGYEGIEDFITLIITGSITTYQYSERSDIDTSLFVDTKNFPEWSRAEMIGLFTEQLDDVPLPGTTYPLQIFVQPDEIKPEMIFKPGLRSGYDLDSQQWLVPPDRTRVADIEKDMHDTYTYALEVADKMDRLLTYEPLKAVQFWNQLHRRRARDQKSGKGDFAPSNVAYKFIVNRGITERLGEIMGRKIVL